MTAVNCGAAGRGRRRCRPCRRAAAEVPLKVRPDACFRLCCCRCYCRLGRRMSHALPRLPSLPAETDGGGSVCPVVLIPAPLAASASACFVLQKQMAEGDPQAQAEQMLKMSTAKIRKARCAPVFMILLRFP